MTIAPFAVRRAVSFAWALAAGAIAGACGCSSVSGLDDLVFDQPDGGAGQGGGAAAGGTGGSAGTGGTSPGGASGGIVELTELAGLSGDVVMAAYGGQVFLALTHATDIERIHFPDGETTSIDLPADLEVWEMGGLHADALGLVWGLVRTPGTQPPDQDCGAVGGFSLDGSSPWSIVQVYPAGHGGAWVRAVTANAASVWTNGNNSELLRLDRGCTGTGTECGTTLLADTYTATRRECIELSADSQYVFHGQDGGVYSLGMSVVERVPADATEVGGDPFAEVSWSHTWVASCALWGGSLAWNDIGYGHDDKILTCPTDAAAPCTGQVAWTAPGPIDDPPGLLRGEGGALYFVTVTDGEASLMRLDAPLQPAAVLASELPPVLGLAVDATAVYWAEQHDDGIHVRALAR